MSRARMHRAILLLVVIVAMSACSDRHPLGCKSDQDCREERICQQGVCTQSGDSDDQDTGFYDQPDAQADAQPDARPDADDPVPTICQQAADLIESCDFPARPAAENQVDWMRCNTLDQCAAQCTLDLECAGLECDWNEEIACDASPWWDCVLDKCQTPPGSSCQADADCVAWDSCCGQWQCTAPEEVEANTCNCVSEIPHPGCGCVDEHCLVEPSAQSICQEAVDHFENTCGHSIESLRQRLPDDHQWLVELRDGECDPTQACTAACLRYNREDRCSECRFTEDVDCVQDPLQPCVNRCFGGIVPEAVLCDLTEGRWGASECENCCEPPACGGDASQQRDCGALCCGPPQCYCPGDKPFWEPQWGCADELRCGG